MKLTLNKSALKDMVKGHSKIINPRNNLPVLGYVRISLRDGEFSAMSTNLEDELIYYPDEYDCDVEQGELLVPLSELKNLAKHKGVGDISIELLEDGRLGIGTTINGQDVGRAINTIPVDEFPNGAAKDVETKPYDVRDFLDRYRRAVPTASTDQSRYVLNGIFLDHEAKAVVSTDGNRLCVYDLPSLPLDASVIIPVTKVLSSDLLQPKKISGGFVEPEDTRIGWRKNAADEIDLLVIETPNWRYGTRVIDEVYLNYAQCMPPRGARLQINFHEEDMETLKAANELFPSNDDAKPVSIYADQERVLVIFQDAEGWSHVVLPKATANGDRRAYVNRLFFMEALKAGFHTVYLDKNWARPIRFEGLVDGAYALMPLNPEKGGITESALIGYVEKITK